MTPVIVTDTDEVWDHTGKLVSSRTVDRDVTPAVVEYALHDRLRKAVDRNRAYRAIPTPTQAQQRAQIADLTRQVAALTRLLLRSDLLLDNDE